DYSNCPSLIGDLNTFNDGHHYEGLVLVTTSFQEHYQQCQQVAVYSENLGLLNQISCELEKVQNSSLVLEPIECVLDQIQVYHMEKQDWSVNRELNASEDEFSTEHAHAQLLSSPIADTTDKKVPQTPMNSLLERSPLDDGLAKLFPEENK
ncbi:PRUN2 protein, partial [Polyodon spathula]|nr:PRUN2 protein [Polyodon spathula]